MRYLTIVVYVFFLSACSTLPAPKKISNFGDATEKTANAFQQALNAHTVIAVKIGEEREADKFLTKQPFTLSDSADALLDQESLGIRLIAIKALGEYGEALKKAADEGVINDLEAAAINLGSATNNFVSYVSPTATPIVGPVIKLTSRTFGWILGNTYASEIQAIISAANDDIQTLGVLLKRDLSIISSNLSQQGFSFEQRRQISLEQVRLDQKVNNLDLYKEFKIARKEINEVKSLMVILSNHERILNELVQTHNALAEESPDSDIALQRFVTIVEGLTEIANMANSE